MKPTLLLFDIDQTLLKKKVTRFDPWVAAINETFDITDSFGHKQTNATTGVPIPTSAKIILQQHGFSDELIDEKLPEFLDVLCQKYDESLTGVQCLIFDDVIETLEKLTEKGYYLGIITANLEQIAIAKLRSCGINHFFETGGYGDGCHNRTEVAAKAYQNACDHFQISFDKSNTYAIGDAQQDIAAGKNNDLIAIGVTTGTYNKNQLKEAGANHVIPSLSKLLQLLEKDS